MLPELTAAQATLLRKLPDRFGVERIRTLWIFPAHQGKARESGLLVLSLAADEDALNGLQALVTVRYHASNVKGQLQIEESTAEEGWAPPERLERVIAGVLARGGEETGDPFEVHVDGREEKWTGMLEKLGVLLDPASQ